jgi:fimbrial chaperone protein
MKLIVVAICLFVARTSAAYQLAPISQVFAPTGANATQSFELVNNGTTRVALKVSFATLERNADYVESNHDAAADFLAYPAQVVLAPGKRQTVRVTWLGTQTPAHELTYRIDVTEVAIETLDRNAKPDAPTGELRVFIDYHGTIFIRPAKATPTIAVDTAEIIVAKGHPDLLAITLANTGSAVGLVKSCTVQITAGGGVFMLSPPALRNTRVLAGSKRRYLVPPPARLPSGSVLTSGRCAFE